MDLYEGNKQLFDVLGMKPIGKTRDVMTYKVTQRICSGAAVLEEVEWKGKYIPIVPVYGEEVWVDGIRHLRSLVRDAKDSQRMLNYWKTTSTELVALAPKAPYIGPVGAFATDGAKWATANTDNHAFIEYDTKDDAGQPIASPPQRQPFGGMPAGAVNEANTAGEDIMSIIGIYKASLGAASNEDSGVAITARDKQADTGTFHFIDNLSRAIRHAGRILLDLIPHVYSTPRILRIIGPDMKPDMVPVNDNANPAMIPMKGPDGAPVMDQNGQVQKIAKVFDLTVGKYDLTVSAGPSYASQRQETADQMMELIRVYPAAAPVIGDLFAKNLDWPGADEVADRLKALLPQQLRGQDPAMQQAHQIIQQGAQRIQELEQQLAALKGSNDIKAGELDVKRFDAETGRLKVIVGNQGAPADPAQLGTVVMTMLMHVLQSPDIFEGMTNGAPPEQLAAMVAQRMQPPGGQPPDTDQPPIAA